LPRSLEHGLIDGASLTGISGNFFQKSGFLVPWMRVACPSCLVSRHRSRADEAMFLPQRISGKKFQKIAARKLPEGTQDWSGNPCFLADPPALLHAALCGNFRYAAWFSGSLFLMRLVNGASLDA
jgi:hypothetical protein